MNNAGSAVIGVNAGNEAAPILSLPLRLPAIWLLFIRAAAWLLVIGYARSAWLAGLAEARRERY